MLRKIPKPILLYFAVVAGIALVIFGTFGISELAHRLKPPGQSIGAPAVEPEHILKIYAWENVWNEEMTEERNIVTEMREGEVIRVGWLKTGIGEFWDEFGQVSTRTEDFDYCYDDAITHGVRHNSIFIADYDGKICVESNGPLFSGELSGGLLSNLTQTQILGGTFNGRYRVVVGANSSGILQCDRIPIRESSPGELYYKSFSQTMEEAWPDRNIPHEYRKVVRYGETETVLISAMDDADPRKIVAQAEIRVTHYQLWELVPAPNPFWDGGTYRRILMEMGLNHPDNFGYTEAVLVKYTQVEEW